MSMMGAYSVLLSLSLSRICVYVLLSEPVLKSLFLCLCMCVCMCVLCLQEVTLANMTFLLRTVLSKSGQNKEASFAEQNLGTHTFLL